MAVSAGLLVFLFSKIDFNRLWAVIKSANPWLVAAAAILNLAFFIVRAVRWRYLMEPVKKGVSLMDLLSATMIGFMANNVLPARLGEFVRAYALARREDVPKSSVFATVVVERLFDTMSVLLLLVVVLAYMPKEIAGGSLAGTFRNTGIVSLWLYAGAITAIGFFVYKPHVVTKAISLVLSPLSVRLADKAAELAGMFATGLGVVRDPKLLALILFYSALHWAPLYLPIWLLFKSFGLGFGVYEALFFLVVTAFSVAVPSTPGFVGTFEAAGAGAMMLLGMDKESALGFAILAHAASFIPVTLIGFVFLYRENLSLSGIREVEAEA